MTIHPITPNWHTYTQITNITHAPTSNQSGPLGHLTTNHTLFTVLLNNALNTSPTNTSIPVPLTNLNPFAAMGNGLIDVHLTGINTTTSFPFEPTPKLEHTLKGKLTGTANHFINAGKKYDIHPALLSAIAIHETGNGSSRAVNEKLNVAGMMGKNGLRTYETLEDSIFDMARNLRENYLNQGRDTIASIGAKYAPVGATNDPTGLNNHWVRGVTNIFTTLT